MNKLNSDNQPSLRVPRNMQIFIIQYLAAFSLLYGFTTLIPLATEAIRQPLINSDLMLLFFFSALPIVCGLAVFYSSQQYVMRITYDKNRNILRITKKRDSHEININGAVSLNSKIIKQQIGGVKHFLVVKFNSHEFEVFKECAPFGNRWESFSEKLSKIIGLPLIKEYWIENYNGKLVQRSRIEHNVGKRQGFVNAIPSLLTLGGSIGYALWPSRWTFIYIGLSVIASSDLFIAIYARKRESKTEDQFGKSYVLIPVLIYSSIKLAILYVFLAFTLSGFKLSGVY